MIQTNQIAGFGTLFPTLAALTAPAQEFLTREPAYRAASGLRIRAGLGSRLRTLFQAFQERREHRRTQRTLARLDDRLLRDIGLSRAEVRRELPEPFAGLGEPSLRDHGVGRGPTLGEAGFGLWQL